MFGIVCCCVQLCWITCDVRGRWMNCPAEREERAACGCCVGNGRRASIKLNDTEWTELPRNITRDSPPPPPPPPPPPLLLLPLLQGSIQQLVLKSDPTAPDDQCEEDDPYVSVHENNTHTHTHTHTHTRTLWVCMKQPKRGTSPPSSGRKCALH